MQAFANDCNHLRSDVHQDNCERLLLNYCRSIYLPYNFLLPGCCAQFFIANILTWVTLNDHPDHSFPTANLDITLGKKTATGDVAVVATHDFCSF